VTAGTSEFWKSHRGLVWSNPQADDSIHIRAALLRPRFDRLLEIAVHFGLDRLRCEWKVLCEEPTPQVSRAAPSVTRILGNIEKGFARADSGN